MSLISPDFAWFSVLDLKDAFFCIPLQVDSQKLFAFQWSENEHMQGTRIYWTVLPQGFKNSPTIFGEALGSDLLR